MSPLTEHLGVNGDQESDAAVVEEQDAPALPASFYTILDDAPPDYDGVTLIQWYAEKVNALPLADRDQVRRDFERLVWKMVEFDASDMDMGGPAGNERVWYRVEGRKRPREDVGRFSVDESDLMLLSLLSPYQQQHFLERYAIDFGYSLEQETAPAANGGPNGAGHVPSDPSRTDPARRFRTTIYFDNKHLALSMRMLAWKPRPLRSLGFHPLIERGLMFRYVRDGLTLVTGVTGSGKSTTLDAIVDANNADAEGQVLIIAQPLEYIHTSRRCIVRHREVGTDVKSFADGMIQGLRQDPDIVVVGEMRDPDTIETAMEMADTGHKVFSTLHTGSAIESIARVVAEYTAAEQDRVRYRLADVLRCIISQKLLPAVGGGRVLAKEVLWMTPSARAAIKNDNANEVYQMIWQGTNEGQITLEQDLFRLVQNGEITAETAVGYANNKRRLLQLMH